MISVLKKSVKSGYTFIITNAGLGWVEITSRRFFPTVHDKLIKNAHKIGIKILSAREMFE